MNNTSRTLFIGALAITTITPALAGSFAEDFYNPNNAVQYIQTHHQNLKNQEEQRKVELEQERIRAEQKEQERREKGALIFSNDEFYNSEEYQQLRNTRWIRR